MAKTANEEIMDALIRHQIYLLRYSNHVRDVIIGILNASEESIVGNILGTARARNGLRNVTEINRLNNLIKKIERIRRESWDKTKQYLIDEMGELAYNEPIYLDGIVKTSLPVIIETALPSALQLRSLVLSNPFEGKVLRDWAKTMEADDLRRIRAVIRSGMVAGEDMAAIARRVVGIKRLKGSNGVTEYSRRQVQSIVRTAVQHYSNLARFEWAALNSDIISEDLYLATLDSRTTLICINYDGQVFPVSAGPRPPLHWGCRSVRVSLINGKVVGNRPAKPVVEKELVRRFAAENGLGRITSRDNLPWGYKKAFDSWFRGQVRSMVGQVPARTSYSAWLKNQSVSFQNEVLGKTRAALFRKGELEINQFVNRNGKKLTLAELSRLHSDAFRAIGLDPVAFN